MWFRCQFLDTEVDGSNLGIGMLCPCARDIICIASVDSAVKCVQGGDNLVKGVQCYELFGGIALKIKLSKLLQLISEVKYEENLFFCTCINQCH